MDTYFFVPGDRISKIDQILSLGVSQIIIDLEDAVKLSEREHIFNVLKNTQNLKSFFIRIPLFDQNDSMMS